MLTLASPNLTPVLAAAYVEFREMVARGEATGAPETPLGAARPDSKQYVDFILGVGGTPAAIKALHEMLAILPYRFASALTEAFGLGDFPPLGTLIDESDGPVLRMTWYPAGAVGEINQPHTDIDLFTILPAATNPGLEVFADGKWVPAGIGRDEVAVLPGEMLEQLGAAKAIKHRVVAGKGHERISSSLFVNASPRLIFRDGSRASDVMKARLDEIRGSGGCHD